MKKATREAYVKAAKEKYKETIGIEIDDCAGVTEIEQTDKGAYVQALIWIFEDEL